MVTSKAQVVDWIKHWFEKYKRPSQFQDDYFDNNICFPSAPHFQWPGDNKFAIMFNVRLTQTISILVIQSILAIE